MTEDSILIACVWLIWTLLTFLYAFVPMLSMPGSVAVWGSGALVFLGIVILTARRETHVKPRSRRR